MSCREVRRPKERTSILVVEDNENLASVLVGSLLAAGYSSSWVNNGAEAVIRFLTSPVDLVITDVFIPRLSGTDLVRILHAMDPEIRIIAITGSLSGVVRAEFGELGVDAFLTKPFRIEELMREVDRAVRP